MYRKTCVEIDIDKIKNNIEKIIKTYSDYSYYIGVVKGNAYGHGYDLIKHLKSGGINYLAVSTLEEAIEVRKYDNNISILCLEPIPLEYINIAEEHDITLCVCNYNYFLKLNETNLTKKIRFHLKLNTGMNRLGIKNKKEIKKIFDLSLKNSMLELEGIFSHFSTTGFYDAIYKKQIDNFKQLTSEIDLSKIKIIHLGKSSSIEYFDKIDFCNGIRLGIIMYGVQSYFPNKHGLRNKLRLIKYDFIRKINKMPNPYFEKKVSLEQALSLKSVVIDIQKININDYVGYGRKYKSDTEGYVAVVPVGYADGIPLNYNNFQVQINNKKYNVVGTVNMGMITVLVDKNVSLDDKVIIYSNQDSYKTIANWFNITPHALLTCINPKIPRIYIENGQKFGDVNEI